MSSECRDSKSAPSQEPLQSRPQAEVDRAFRERLISLDSLEDPGVPLRYPQRDPGRVPDEREDPHNAIIRFCEVRGAEDGPLAGKRIGVKDNIPVGGVPMTRGQRSPSPPVPMEDAVVVERLLDAGAIIVAKTNISDGSGVAPFGDTRNPHNPLFSPGFTSSGSGAAVAANCVDGALGTDIAGSVRIPAAWCGVVGMKPTRGLVPLHGCGDRGLNSIGPLTATVNDNAVMLTAMAGSDWRDPESAPSGMVSTDYNTAADLGIDGMRIGVITESLERAGCTAGTLASFDRAQKNLADLGAEVSNVSVPLWGSIAALYWPYSLLGEGISLVQSGYSSRGRVDLGLLRAQYRIPGVPNQLRSTAVALMWQDDDQLRLLKAQNLVLELRRQIDALLANVDLLITPTTVTGPFMLNDQPSVDLAVANTWAFNLTGHPALSVPAGHGDDDLPTGLQVIGRRFDEYTIYRAAFSFETNMVR